MLKEQAAIGDLAADPPCVHGALHLPGPDVVHGVRPEADVRIYEFSIHDIETTARTVAVAPTGDIRIVITEEELRAMSHRERRHLARALARIDYPHPLTSVTRARRRQLAVWISVTSCVVLAAWIIVLALTLRHSFHTRYWTSAWVGYDIFLLAGFAATGWAAWRGRQVVIACLIVTGTLLCCDAWFDVVLDLGTRDLWQSIASAVLIELPLAWLMFSSARRLIRLSAVIAVSRPGHETDADGIPRDTLPPLWKLPLFGGQPAEPVPAPDGQKRRRTGRGNQPVSRGDDPT
jgi:hypothetical protein